MFFSSVRLRPLRASLVAAVAGIDHDRAKAARGREVEKRRRLARERRKLTRRHRRYRRSGRRRRRRRRRGLGLDHEIDHDPRSAGGAGLIRDSIRREPRAEIERDHLRRFSEVDRLQRFGHRTGRQRRVERVRIEAQQQSRSLLRDGMRGRRRHIEGHPCQGADRFDPCGDAGHADIAKQDQISTACGARAACRRPAPARGRRSPPARTRRARRALAPQAGRSCGRPPMPAAAAARARWSGSRRRRSARRPAASSRTVRLNSRDKSSSANISWPPISRAASGRRASRDSTVYGRADWAAGC